MTASHTPTLVALNAPISVALHSKHKWVGRARAPAGRDRWYSSTPLASKEDISDDAASAKCWPSGSAFRLTKCGGDG